MEEFKSLKRNDARIILDRMIMKKVRKISSFAQRQVMVDEFKKSVRTMMDSKIIKKEEETE